MRGLDEWVSFFAAGSLPAMEHSLGLSYSELGLVLASVSLGGIIGVPIGNLAADYLDRRRLVLVGAFGYAVALAGFGLASDLVSLVLAGFCWGMSSDLLVHPLEIDLAERMPDRLEHLLSRQQAISALGDLLSPLTIAAFIALGFSWREVFLGGAIVMTLYSLWLIGLPTLRPLKSPDTERTAWRSLLATLCDQRVIFLAAILTLFSTLDEPFLGFTLVYFEDRQEIGSAAGQILVGALLVAAIAGNLAVPWLRRRLDRDRLTLALAIGIALTIAAMLLSPRVEIVAPAMVFIGFAGAAFYTVLQTRVLTVRPGEAGATETVISYADTFAFLVPPAVGLVADHFGLFSGMLIYLAIPILIVPLLFALRRTG